MGRNLELKARIGSIAALEQRARGAGAAFRGVLLQTDTYFHVRHGRMKLREQEGLPAELVVYTREESTEERDSRYRRIPVTDGGAMKAGLAESLGILTVVRKERRLFIYRGARIHLDRVEGVGEYLEFEVPVPGESDPAALMAELRRIFDVKPKSVEKQSYSDLLVRRAGV
jgi:predicted adenylyl cyclase CyaB